MMQDVKESACLGKMEDHYLTPLRQHLQALLFQDWAKLTPFSSQSVLGPDDDEVRGKITGD